MAFTHTFKYLLNGKEVVETKSKSASKAIRYNCLDCSGGSYAAVSDCDIAKCPLWPFREGKSRPYDEAKAKLARERGIGFKKKSVSHDGGAETSD